VDGCGLLFAGDDNAIWNLPERRCSIWSGLFVLVGLATALRTGGNPLRPAALGVLLIAPVALVRDGSPNFRTMPPYYRCWRLFGLGVTTLYRSLTTRQPAALGAGDCSVDRL
jgi:hypothetical protein